MNTCPTEVKVDERYFQKRLEAVPTTVAAMAGVVYEET